MNFPIEYMLLVCEDCKEEFWFPVYMTPRDVYMTGLLSEERVLRAFQYLEDCKQQVKKLESMGGDASALFDAKKNLQEIQKFIRINSSNKYIPTHCTACKCKYNKAERQRRY